jgi:Outer membrane protein beta-barrel domain
MNFGRTAIALLAFLAAATNARADWLFAGYMGASGTSSDTLTVTPTTGAPFSLNDVAYKGQAFRSPWYYGVRVSFVPPRDVLGLSPEIEWTHAKAIAQIDPRSSELNAFQQSHGLNFLLGNLAYRFAPLCAGRCTPVVRGGAGISTPHVESTFRNVHQEQYQRGGFAWQLGAGVEYRVWQFVYGVADARITRVTEKHLRAAGADIAGSFFTRHVDFGVALRLPER